MILNLLVLGVVCAGVAVISFVLLSLTEDRAIHSRLKLIATYAYLFIVSGVTFFPFSHLDLSSLGSPEKSLASGGLLLCTYGFVFVLLRVPFKGIATNIVVLFQQKYLGIYVGLILFSVLWSQTHLLTLKAALSLIFISSFAVYYARQYDYPIIFQLLRWNQTFIAIASVYMAIFVPSEGIIEKGWGGAIGHPIDLGNMMALTASLWLLNAIHNRRYRLRSLVICVFSIVIMQFANSAGAFVIFLSLVVIVLGIPLFRKLKFLQANFLFLLILIFFSALSIWVVSNFNQITSLLGKDATFTGRVPLWNLLIEEYVQKRLWLGYGHSGFWQHWQESDNPAVGVFRLLGDWTVHAHNGFLDIILSFGIIGFTLFALSFLMNVGRAIKLILTDRRSETILPLIILTYVFMSNLSHSPIVTPGYVWFLYVLTTVKLQINISRKKRYQMS